MSNAARVTFTENDNTFSIAGFENGTVAVVGRFKRGPINKPAEYLFTSYNQFQKVMGGLLDGITDAPLLAKRMFDKGCRLRVVNIKHYTDITDSSTLSALKATTPITYILTLAGPLITGNTVSLTIGGVATSQVFSNTSDETWALFKNKIALATGVLGAVIEEVPGDTENDRVIYFYSNPNNAALTLTLPVITGGVSQTTMAVTTLASSIVTATNQPLFEVEGKYEGVDYNNILVSVRPATNGQASYFNLLVTHKTDNNIYELFENLQIIDNPNIANSHYLDTANQVSNVVKFTYIDISGLSGQLRPRDAIYKLVGGSDGGAITLADYIGDQTAKTGIRALDNIDDAIDFGVLDRDDVQLHNEGESYSGSRQDMFYWGHLSNALTTADALVSQRAATVVNGSYAALVAGGLKVLHPVTGALINISELGDVMAIQAATDYYYGPWYATAGLQRGIIKDALGVVNNFGATGQYPELNLLANRQVNMVIEKNNQVVFWGNYTLQISNSQLTQISVRRFLIWLKKSLRPTLERYLFEPNDIPSWKKLYFEVKPFLDSLVEKRAMYDYQWQGDQFAKNLNSLQTNDKADVQRGKYKVKLLMQIIPAILEIGVELTLTPTGVSFDDFSLQTNL